MLGIGLGNHGGVDDAVHDQLLPTHMFAGATEWVIWMSVAAYAVTFAVAFMLPERAREGAGAF